MLGSQKKKAQSLGEPWPVFELKKSFQYKKRILTKSSDTNVTRNSVKPTGRALRPVSVQSGCPAEGLEGVHLAPCRQPQSQLVSSAPPRPLRVSRYVLCSLQDKVHKLFDVKGVVGKLRMFPQSGVVALENQTKTQVCKSEDVVF